MKIAILTLKKLKCCDLLGLLRNSARKINKDIIINRIFLEDIFIKWKEGKIKVINSENVLLKYDVLIFRLQGQIKEKAYFIAKAAEMHKKIVINESYCIRYVFSDKLSLLNLLEQLKLNHPKTYYVDSSKLLLKVMQEITFPCIIKNPFGWQGERVEKIINKEGLEKIRKNFPKYGLIIQEFVPIKSDTRVLVVGYKAIGAIKRIAPKNDFRTNLSLGGTGKKIQLTAELKKIAEKLARETKSDILGVDFIQQKKKIGVLEINNCPGFNGFKKYTGIVPEDALIKYIINKYKKNGEK